MMKKQSLRFGLLSLDQLKQLRGGRHLEEKDQIDKKNFFQKALKAYREEIQHNPSSSDAHSNTFTGHRKAYDKFQSNFLEPNSPPIKFIGEGFGRIVFAVGGAECVCKFATDEIEGIAQNKQEISLLKKYRGWPCFVELDDYDKVSFYGIQEEACAKIDDGSECLADRLLSSLGLESADLNTRFMAIGVMCAALASSNRDVKATIQHMFKTFPWIARSFQKSEVRDFLNSILNTINAQAKVLEALVRFYEDTPHNIEILQDTHSENWAFTYRYGELVCVLIDLGL